MVIFTNLHVVNTEPILLSDFIENSLKRDFDVPFQNAVSVLRTPNEMVIQIVNRSPTIC